MTQASSQGNQGGDGSNTNTNQGGTNDGGNGAQNTNTNQSNTNQGAQGGSQFDPKTATPEQLAAVLENPNFWQLSRVKELQNDSKAFKDLQSKQQQENEKKLAEEKKFEELAQAKDQQLQEANKKIENFTINQALTAKLMPLGVVDLEAALALIDRSAVKIGENGTVEGIDQAIESLKTGKQYLFNSNGQGGGSGVGTNTNQGNTGDGGTPKFKRSQLQDQAFYAANREAILKAAAAGLIEDDLAH